MKILGAALATFINEAWPGDDWYWDHYEFDELPDPLKMYDTDDLGDLMWQGSGPDPSGGGLSSDSLLSYWLAMGVTNKLIVTVPSERYETLKAYITELGGTYEPL